MTSEEIRRLKARLDALEAQQAVMAGFISVLLQFQKHLVPAAHRAAMRAVHEEMLEKMIATLLASDLGFSDAAVHSVEHFKNELMRSLDVDNVRND